MTGRLSQEEERFREEVQTFLRERLPEHLSESVRLAKRLTKEQMQQWHAILHGRGWLAPNWPAKWGGPGWSVMQRVIFETETALAFAPRIVPFGINMLGPVLIEYGTDEQKRYWLPRILDGSDWWCQGYSETGAGSDLASLQCSAVADGDHFIVNGQKTWTTFGHYANMIFCLVRTNPRTPIKQEGISFLLIDMHSSGVEVRPILLLDGEHEVNEVFLDNVRVPRCNLVGEENKGWLYAKYLLTHERTNIAGVGASLAAFAWLEHIAQILTKRGRPLARDPYFAARMAMVKIDLDNLQTTSLRVMAKARGGAPGQHSSMLKIRGTEIRQEIASLARRALGPYAQPFVSEALDGGYCETPIGPHFAASVAATYFNSRKLSIFGGSNEIQREIIAKDILEL
jgi:alkylation response protein AidB-like acyl-CoA dehydrogenase